MNFIKRRNFLKTLAPIPVLAVSRSSSNHNLNAFPIILSTWDFGLDANKAAMEMLKKTNSALDAVEAGVRVPEADASNSSVGYGGLPDRDGRVTLDACIMDHNGNAGSVCSLEHIMHPISVARKVMEKTPHVMLVGDGALQFALEQGFNKENLLTAESKQKWEEWKKTSKYAPVINIENHDTIGMIAVDSGNRFAGACTTSGLAYKMHGRVGDSPIIGSGLYVDNEVGAATGTGLGEKVLTQCSAFLIVELMRQGYSPQRACEAAITRIIKKNKDDNDFQVAFIAVNKKGQVGAYSIQPGFTFALTTSSVHKKVSSNSFLKK
jgi:N4-(beta-N-acetylglucosaminyl)-L-asparaginase